MVLFFLVLLTCFFYVLHNLLRLWCWLW